jgi:hypothetical protein
VFMRFLTEATANDSALMRFIQCFAGYCLTGETIEHMRVRACRASYTGFGNIRKLGNHLLTRRAGLE